MRLTKKKAIELSIEQWEWLAETGKYKSEWPGWEKYGNVFFGCFLCARHLEEEGSDCQTCPLYKEYGYCSDGKSHFAAWDKAKTESTRKKYAKLFLEQLKGLTNGTN